VKAVVLREVGGDLALEEWEEPSGVVVEVRAAGVNFADVLIRRGLYPQMPELPYVLVAELAGELEDGSRVTVVHRVPCGTCERCRAGHQSTCGEFQAVRIEPGGFAEYLRASHCVPLPAELDPLDGIWVDSLACVLRARERVPRGRVLVVGCGAVGLLWIQALLARGDEVVAADLSDDRLAHARELGADARDRGRQLVGRARQIDRDEAGVEALDRVRRHAIRQRLALAELGEQPAALTAEDRDEDLEREPIRRVDRGAREADHEVGLRAIEIAIDLAIARAAIVELERRDRDVGRCARGARRPRQLAEPCGDLGDDVVELDVADDRERHAGHRIARAVERGELAARHRVDRGRRAEHVAAVGVRAVQRLAEQPERGLARARGLRLLLVEQQPALARELGGRQRGREHAIREQREPGAPRSREPLGRHPEAVAPRDARQAAAEPIDLVGDRLAVALAAAAGQQAREQGRGAGVRRVLEPLAAAPHRAHRDDRHRRIAAH